VTQHRPRLPARTVAAALLLVAAVALAACSNPQPPINRTPQSGSTTAAATNGVQQVRIVVDDRYRFYPSTVTVHPGRVEITLVHRGNGAPHTLQVLGFPVDFVPLVRPGQTSSATFGAPAPGRYTFVCTIHRVQGQIGTLIVLPSPAAS
jgi:plastocyanin